MAAKKLVFYPDRCTGCKICMLECILNHGNAIDYSKSLIRIRINKEKVIQVAEACVQCEEAPCIDACPVGALSKDEELGRIQVDRDICNLCEECVRACPYHGITVSEKDGKIMVCDLCGGDPACVKWCPTKAVEYLEITEEQLPGVKQLREKIVQLHSQISIESERRV